MRLKDRIRSAERRTGLKRDPPCKECGGRIIFEEIDEDGMSTYPQGGPCESCGSRGSGGRIGRIIVDRRKTEDRRSHEREDAFTFKLDRPGDHEESEDTEWP